MAQYVFADEDGVPVARPADTEVDGNTTFDLKGAMSKYGMSAQTLRAIWEADFGPADGGSKFDQTAVDALNAAWRDDPAKRLIRQETFGHVNDVDFAIFLAKCQQRDVDPWKGEVFCALAWNEKRQGMEVKLVLSIEKMRDIAHASRAYAGIDDPDVMYEGPDPVISTIRVHKLVQGVKCSFSGEATAEEFRPPKGTSPMWDSKPRVCLNTVAERNALAKAYPKLAAFYTFEELAKSPKPPTNRPNGGGPESTNKTQPPAEDDTPHSTMGFHLALQELGLKTHEQRQAVINQYSLKYPNLHEQDERAFYRIVLNAVRAAPSKHGVVSM